MRGNVGGPAVDGGGSDMVGMGMSASDRVSANKRADDDARKPLSDGETESGGGMCAVFIVSYDVLYTPLLLLSLLASRLGVKAMLEALLRSSTSSRPRRRRTKMTTAATTMSSTMPPTAQPMISGILRAGVSARSAARSRARQRNETAAGAALAPLAGSVVAIVGANGSTAVVLPSCDDNASIS